MALRISVLSVTIYSRVVAADIARLIVSARDTRVSKLLRRRARANKAIAYLRDHHRRRSLTCRHGTPWHYHCAHSVACAYGKLASGWDAYQGFVLTPPKYRRDGRKRYYAPRGALVFWKGGSQGYGHVGISNGRGRFWGVDLPESFHVGLAEIRDVEEKWGMRYVGWVWPDQVAGW